MVHPTELSDLGRAALAYAYHGLAVFPVRPNGKTPISSCSRCRATRCPGPDYCGHGECHGHLDATTDPGRITTWWTRWPRCNIGIACGPSGLAVVDLDGPDGVRQWQELTGVRATARTLTTRTPSGGAHLWYAARTDRPMRNSVKELAGDIDTRGTGGYIVAPPSRRADGAYTATVPFPGHFWDLPKIPDWVLDTLDRPRPSTGRVRTATTGAGGQKSSRRRAAYVRAVVQAEVDQVATTPEGGRNFALFAAAEHLGEIVAAGALGTELATAALLGAAITAGLPEAEAERTIRSGLARGSQSPRELPA